MLGNKGRKNREIVVKSKAATMIGLAVVFGGASIFVADMWLKNAAAERAKQYASNDTQAPAQQFQTIVVAKEQLKYGVALTPQMLQEIPWAKGTLPGGSFEKIADVEKAGKRVVLAAIEPNEPVLLSKLSGPDGRATLSNSLAPGMRAVTISTDEVAAVAGFITSGDHVDVILTRNLKAPANELQPNGGEADVSSETILSNVKVLSIEGVADAAEFGAKSADTVTLEVDDAAVKKIALARSIGTLTLSLRAAGENTAHSPEAGAVKVSDLFSAGAKLIDDIKTVSVTSEPDKNADKEPAFKTVIVTRGLVQEAYQVIEEN